MNKILWRPSPSNISNSRMTSFIKFINQRYELSIEEYHELHAWSISNIESFWGSLSTFFNIEFQSKPKNIVKKSNKIYLTQWFAGAKLNYAENMLKPDYLNNVAIESFDELGNHSSLKYKDVYRKVCSLAKFLQEVGFSKGDRMAAVMPNSTETIIASLASSSIGGIWSSCSPDFGFKSIFDRFSQIDPKVLIICESYSFKGKTYDCTDRIKKLISSIKSIEKVIIVNHESSKKMKDSKCVYWNNLDFSNNDSKIKFSKMSFNDPLYIMFSSGTTGKPKSIVHSVGGTLIQHIKELGLHTDLRSKEKILYYTTCGWMMWNWLLSSMYFGSTIVLYEGNPFYPRQDSLLKIINDNNINVFGTSAKYISYLQSEDITPKDKYDFKELRLILSTGSTLTEENFDYVYDRFKKDVQLSSISGGTDIISCFALGNPVLSVHRGELQCIGLGMDVLSYDLNGNPINNQKGELVCKSPFPSMPICFWNDKDGSKYYNSYFNKYENVWTHGDFIEINDYSGVIVYGRSDATLNPNGIRIGTSEIYSAIDSILEVKDSIAANSNLKDEYILFVKLLPGSCLNKKLISDIKSEIRNNLSPKHLPAYIIQIQDIPYTLNGKKVELAIKNIIDGNDIKNVESISNPDCLGEYYKKIKS